MRKSITRQQQIVTTQCSTHIREHFTKGCLACINKGTSTHNRAITSSILKAIEINWVFLQIHDSTDLARGQSFVIYSEIIKPETWVIITPTPSLITAQANILKISTIGKDTWNNVTITGTRYSPWVCYVTIYIYNSLCFCHCYCVVMPITISQPILFTMIKRISLIVILSISKVAPTIIINLE